MPKHDVARLRDVRTFRELIAYLRDEMGWPIQRDSLEDADDLYYEFTPEELGIDPRTSAKIKRIQRLRPLAAGQPWGIFFVEFEPKSLPVVALRRILGQVALKKRASANKSERQAWSADDLLFVSNFGNEGDDRRISFAHFSAPEDGTDLPTLKVLGWDNLDTPLHLDDVAERLTRDLAWPEDPRDRAAWRQKWREAFILRHREVITTSKALAVRLAELARGIRDRIKTALAIETETGPLTRLMESFRAALVHDLDADGFADMYAQTIAYGLLSARIADPTKKTADDFAAHMRTNPFLRELMETFLKIGGRRGKAGGPGIDFDELGVSEVVELLDDANMEAVVRDFGDRNPQEDPVIHFYELFLKEYDAGKRMTRGVFYTPRQVVSYIVRSVDELLRREFGLADGLADITTWGEIAKRHKDIEIPNGTSPDQDFVQILDPAAGTGTFLVEIIDLIYKTLVAKWSSQGDGKAAIEAKWNAFVPRHLLTRLHGYELLMAPYAIAHLKLSLKLHETGYRFGHAERARIYLTNALEPPKELSGKFDFAVSALAHESRSVSTIKKERRFTVIVGNPPYSASATTNPWIVQLMSEWKRGLDETKFDIMREEWKFLRLAQAALSSTGSGILAAVINRDFLDGITKRRLRESLQETFTFRRVIDLNGDVKGEVADENVFEIMQGVCVVVLSTQPIKESQSYMSLEGSRQEKYALLSSDSDLPHQEHTPAKPLFKWSTREKDDIGSEYQAFLPLNRVFKIYSSGIQTQRDGVCIAWNAHELWTRVTTIVENSPEIAREILAAGKDGRDWKMSAVRSDVLSIWPDQRYAIPVLYRPFDIRYTIWTGKTKGFHAYPRRDVMKHMVGRKNIGLIFNRQIVGESVSHFGVSQLPTCWGVFYLGNKGSDYLAPLFLTDDLSGESLLDETTARSTNLSGEWLSMAGSCLGEETVDPQDHLGYLYGFIHSPEYRARYRQRLKEDFARVAVPRHPRLFKAIAKLGCELVGLHTFASDRLDRRIAGFAGSRETQVERIAWSQDTVWLNHAKTAGFKGILEEVWNFHIGGYQVCEKWLKDRKGRTLSPDDIAHYQKIIVAISETIRLMKEIDEVIEQHGGWPGAFQTGGASA